MVCLDTSLIVDFLRGQQGAVDAVRRLRSKSEPITVAAPTVMELVSGAARHLQGEEQDLVDDFLLSVVVLALDTTIARSAGEIEAKLILGGETVPAVDIMIGAIAKHHNEAVLTRNVKHFSRMPGVEVVSY